MFFRKKYLLGKIEGTYGSDSAPAATDAILTTNLSINPYEGNRVSRNLDREYLGGQEEINTGPLVRGDLGSRFVRRDYTVIGDTVNRANRYETACPPGRVMISQSTRAQLGHRIEVEAVPGLTLKGVDRPVVGYVVSSLAPSKEDEL